VEFGAVRSDRKLNSDSRISAFVLVELLQPTPDLASLNTNDRIVAGRIIRGALEHVGPDRAFLELVSVASQPMLYNVL